MAARFASPGLPSATSSHVAVTGPAAGDTTSCLPSVAPAAATDLRRNGESSGGGQEVAPLAIYEVSRRGSMTQIAARAIARRTDWLFFPATLA
jgi:hypothetical protein